MAGSSYRHQAAYTLNRPFSPVRQNAAFEPAEGERKLHTYRKDTMDRLALRLDELARALGISRRALERVRSAGRFPRPDVVIGRIPLWRPETVRAWLERGGRP